MATETDMVWRKPHPSPTVSKEGYQWGQKQRFPCPGHRKKSQFKEQLPYERRNPTFRAKAGELLELSL